MKFTLAQAREYGFSMDTARGWLDWDRLPQLARDAALVTAPNTGIPAELSTYFNPKVVTVLTAPLKARAIFNEEKNGDATTTAAKFRMVEVTGSTQPYNDFSNGGNADTNYNWVPRDNYLFETTRRYGSLEEERAAIAKINLAGDTQMAAAKIIDIDANKFYLRGVAGLRNYGLLNDPGLNATISPAPTGTGSSPLWANKTTKQRYDDCLLLFQTLVTQLNGNVESTDELTLVMSPALNVLLGAATDFNVSVLDMLNKYFTRLKIVTVPEYSTPSGQLMQFIAPNIAEEYSGILGFSEKFRAFPLIPQASSFIQKFRAGTYGAIITRPAAIAGMLGM